MKHSRKLFVSIFLLVSIYSCSKKNYPVSTMPIDGDGNTYQTVIIGEQEWFAENLKTTSYNNGKPIKQLPISSGKASYYWYDNDTIYKGYGGLYTWGAVISDKLCPTDWRVPTRSDWEMLERQLQTQEENIAKALASQDGWMRNHQVGTIGYKPETNNSSGFKALPAGSYRGKDGKFRLMGSSAFFWTKTTVGERYTYVPFLNSARDSISHPSVIQTGAHSVRCIKK